MISKKKIVPSPMPSDLSVTELIDRFFVAYNSARLREICQLLKQIYSTSEETTIGVSISGALTPAGLGTSILAPLIRAGLIDWIVSTGANLYHDIHHSLDMDVFSSQPFLDDAVLREQGIIRIYDLIFDYNVLLDTDSFLRDLLKSAVFQREMSSAEFHFLLGQYVFEIENKKGVEHGLLGTAWECGVPIYTSSPGDSSIGMNVAAMEFTDHSALRINPNRDVMETTAIVYGARELIGGKSGVLILGGGSPKNFLLQTQPQIHEVLGLPERGHDYFMQITDARPDTGGLSGATPSEAVSWGKVDPEQLPNSIVCYTDSTIALPLISAYLLQSGVSRSQKNLYQQREKLLSKMLADMGYET